jgi:hypothetical protein
MSKYETDGHLETIDPERLTLGCVVRMTRGPGESLSAFSDTVVIGIHVSRLCQGTYESHKTHYETLAQALKAKRGTDYVIVSLARPYLYCNNPFVSMPNCVMSMERYEAMGDRLCESFKVVVNSRGEYDSYMIKPILR